MHPISFPPLLTHSCSITFLFLRSIRISCSHTNILLSSSSLSNYSSLSSNYSLPSSDKTKMGFEDGFVQSQAKYDCLLFDLDDTLYPLSSGISEQILDNIHAYMVEKLGVEEDKLHDLSDLLYKNYGTTLAGLRAIGYDFNYDEYHSFVHGRLNYDLLKPDPVLKSLLLSCPIRKLIFTNADKVHAIKALNKLGLEDCFEGMICFETLNDMTTTPSDNKKNEIFDIIGFFNQSNDNNKSINGGVATPGILPKTPVVCKPQVSAIEKALAIANLDPQRTIFFEDSVRNIKAGKSLGMDTVLVGKSQRPKGADYALENLHNLKEAIPELWESATDHKITDQVYAAGNQVTALETSVTA